MNWEVEVEALHDAGDKVVAIVRQRGRSKTSGLHVVMAFGQVFTPSGMANSARMEMSGTTPRPWKPWGCRTCLVPERRWNRTIQAMGLPPPAGFEDRMGHQTPAAP